MQQQAYGLLETVIFIVIYALVKTFNEIVKIALSFKPYAD